MKTKFYPILLCAALCACGGGNAKQPVADVETTKDTMQVTKGVSKPGGIPYLDFNKKYPSKDICLEEIANVSYIPLETTDKSLIQTILKIDMSDNIIIIGDYSKLNTIYTEKQLFEIQKRILDYYSLPLFSKRMKETYNRLETPDGIIDNI